MAGLVAAWRQGRTDALRGDPLLLGVRRVACQHRATPVILCTGEHVADVCADCSTFLGYTAWASPGSRPNRRHTAMTNTTSSSSSASGGVGVLGLLGVAFVVLKLVGVIDWSWWLVTLPFWGGFVLVLAIGVLVLIGWLITKLVRALRRRK